MPPWLDPRGSPATITTALQFAAGAAMFPVIVALVIAFASGAEHPLARACTTGGPWIPALLVLFTWEWSPRPDGASWLFFRDSRPITEPDLRIMREMVFGGAIVLAAVAAWLTLRFAKRRSVHGLSFLALAGWIAAGLELSALIASTAWIAEHTANLHEPGALGDLLVPVVISAGFGGLAVLATSLAVDAARRARDIA